MGSGTFPWNCLLHGIHHWHRAYFFLRRGISSRSIFRKAAQWCDASVQITGESYEVWRNQAQLGWVWTSGSFVMTSVVFHCVLFRGCEHSLKPREFPERKGVRLQGPYWVGAILKLGYVSNLAVAVDFMISHYNQQFPVGFNVLGGLCFWKPCPSIRWMNLDVWKPICGYFQPRWLQVILKGQLPTFSQNVMMKPPNHQQTSCKDGIFKKQIVGCNFFFLYMRT